MPQTARVSRRPKLMDFDLNEWLKLLTRWVHVFAGIMWVGTTYYFTWLDGRFSELEKALSANATKKDNRVWMVHSGGFYAVEKLKVPEAIPEKLHWFRWEAAITWLSGFLLLIMVYYHGGLMVDYDKPQISLAGAVWLSMGLLAVSWVVYDLLWFKLVKDQRLATGISFLIVTAVAWALSRVFEGRAMYMEIGAIFGTIMAANVWMRILPAQRRMVAALKEGKEPNQAEALRAKTSSKHNTFLVVPVVFIMISNHFPSITYGSQRYGWVVLSVLVLLGWAAAKVIRRA
jgi:uncharacterized membrane protein